MVHWNAASSRDVLAQQRLFGGRAEFVQVAAHAQDDLFRVENLSRVGRRTMLGAAAALDAGEGLQRVDARHVLAGIQAEILVAGERRNAAEALPLEEYRDRTQHQVQMLGVRNQRQEDQQRQRVQPPHALSRERFLVDPEPGQIGDHQHEDQQRDEARFRRHFAQPHGPHHEAAHEQPGDRDRHRHRQHRHESEVEAAETRIARQKPRAECRRNVIQRDQREGQKSPEDEGVREAGQRPLLDHLPLQHDFPEKLPDPRPQRRQLEIRRGARTAELHSGLCENATRTGRTM